MTTTAGAAGRFHDTPLQRLLDGLSKALVRPKKPLPPISSAAVAVLRIFEARGDVDDVEAEKLGAGFWEAHDLDLVRASGAMLDWYSLTPLGREALRRAAVQRIDPSAQ